MTIGENIRHLRELHELTQRELGSIVGVSDKAVSTWENGIKTPRMDALKRMADYFGVTVGDLLADDAKPVWRNPKPPLLSEMMFAWGCSPEQLAVQLRLPASRIRELLSGAEPTAEEVERFMSQYNVPRTVLKDGAAPIDNTNVRPFSLPAASRRIPVLGRVPAGIPIEAVTDIVEEIELTGHADGYAYFGLLVTGDSMVPEYRDGDIVILRMQQTAQTGDDVVAYIGNSDATLKRLTVTENGIQLRPLNPAYNIRAFSNDEIRTLPVTIAGIVVELRRVRRHG